MVVRRRMTAVLAAFGAMAGGAAAAAPLPAPVLQLDAVERYSTASGRFTRYRFDVANKGAYPADLFAAAPDLPPCGTNTKASRTWVDFFAENGRRLYGFCALATTANLNAIWFATPDGEAPPQRVYIELTDRQTKTKYKSNLADLSPESLMALAQAKSRQGQGQAQRAFHLAERAIFLQSLKGPVDEKWYQDALGFAEAAMPPPR